MGYHLWWGEEATQQRLQMLKPEYGEPGSASDQPQPEFSFTCEPTEKKVWFMQIHSSTLFVNTPIPQGEAHLGYLHKNGTDRLGGSLKYTKAISVKVKSPKPCD